MMSACVRRSYVTYVLDSSGSMGCLKSAVIPFMDEQIKTLQSPSEDGVGLEVHSSLVTFSNYDRIDFSFFDAPAEGLRGFKEDEYNPNGGTALYDALGLVIGRIKSEITDCDDDDVSHLFVIVTDGQENASKTFDSESIQRLVSGVCESGAWTFTFAGAGGDVYRLCDLFGLDHGNVTEFERTVASVENLSHRAKAGTMNYLSSMSSASCSSLRCCRSFYASS